jgi:hypothetical protein
VITGERAHAQEADAVLMAPRLFSRNEWAALSEWSLGTGPAPYYSKTHRCPPNDSMRCQFIMNCAILIWGPQRVFIHEWPGVTTSSTSVREPSSARSAPA